MAVPHKTEVCCGQLYRLRAWAFTVLKTVPIYGVMFLFDWSRLTPLGFAKRSQQDAESIQFHVNQSGSMIIETSSFETIPLRPVHVRPRHLRPIFSWPRSFETVVVWDHIHLRPIHLRPHSFETYSFEATFIWDHIHLTSC